MKQEVSPRWPNAARDQRFQQNVREKFCRHRYRLLPYWKQKALQSPSTLVRCTACMHDRIVNMLTTCPRCLQGWEAQEESSLTQAQHKRALRVGVPSPIGHMGTQLVRHCSRCKLTILLREVRFN